MSVEVGFSLYSVELKNFVQGSDVMKKRMWKINLLVECAPTPGRSIRKKGFKADNYYRNRLLNQSREMNRIFLESSRASSKFYSRLSLSVFLAASQK